jgi:hypothetical protein
MMVWLFFSRRVLGSLKRFDVDARGLVGHLTLTA